MEVDPLDYYPGAVVLHHNTQVSTNLPHNFFVAKPCRFDASFFTADSSVVDGGHH